MVKRPRMRGGAVSWGSFENQSCRNPEQSQKMGQRQVSDDL